MAGVDLGTAVELAPRVWWVGSLLPGDDFQCHVYLIEQGDQSVLIDPGSALNVDEVIRKIDAVVGVALRRRGEGCDAVVARADALLYHAKAEGRDRVAIAD